MSFQDLLVADLSKVPGAFQHTLERRVLGGLIEYEQAPAGWLTKDGKVRLEQWRAYHFTPDPVTCEPCEGTGRIPGARPGKTKQCPDCKATGNRSRRGRVQSVSTLLDKILPKGGLPVWAEARGIEGAIEAIQLGIIPILFDNTGIDIGDGPGPRLDPDAAANAVELVRAAKLGADKARDEAATRGINVHDLLQGYMETEGDLPDPAMHPIQHQGYVRGLADWLDAVRPEPVAVEEIVCDPAAGYAGRYDLCAKVDGQVGLFDAKTQEKGQIFDRAHVQVELYRRALLASGDGAVDFTRVVVFSADGDWRQMDAAADGELVEFALQYADALKPVSSACASANRREVEARKVVA